MARARAGRDEWQKRDATGVLVLAKERCRTGHFWVAVAPEKHVLFHYTKRHDSEAVDSLLAGYSGYLVADAHAVYDHLYLKTYAIRSQPSPTGETGRIQNFDSANQVPAASVLGG